MTRSSLEPKVNLSVLECLEEKQKLFGTYVMLQKTVTWTSLDLMDFLFAFFCIVWGRRIVLQVPPPFRNSILYLPATFVAVPSRFCKCTWLLIDLDEIYSCVIIIVFPARIFLLKRLEDGECHVTTMLWDLHVAFIIGYFLFSPICANLD